MQCLILSVSIWGKLINGNTKKIEIIMKLYQ